MSRDLVIGVTGATGFIGQALVKELADRGYSRLRLFSRSLPVNIAGYSTEQFNSEACNFEGIDRLVHLAGDRGEGRSDLLIEANVALTENIARAAVRAKLERVVFASSINVFGKSSAEPVTPDSPLEPDNAYGRSKVAAERALRQTLAGSATRAVIVRPCMVYGPQTSGSFYALAKLARSGVPLPFGSATAQRSVCSVKNAVSALIFALITATPPAVLLPADPEDTSTRQIIQRAQRGLSRPSRLIAFPTIALRVLLRMAGRGDMAASLLEPLSVDRTHWRAAGWKPPESGEVGMARALEIVE